MIKFDEIKNIIEPELKVFNELYEKELSSSNDLLNKVLKYVAKGEGKKIRPILTILSARMVDVDASIEETCYSAVALEYLHTSSLVHDDVIDEATTRRGRDSVNKLWDNKVAVLTGDFILSKVLFCATKTQNLQIVNLISSLGAHLSEGELLQMKLAQNNTFKEEDYFEVIYKKTAVLFETAMQCGVLSVSDDVDKLNALLNYGKNIGMAFQIRDDIFDYYDDKNVGKPTGNDIREGKVTLPLLYALKNADTSLLNRFSQSLTSEDIDFFISYAKQNGGIKYAESMMANYIDSAIQNLSIFPDSFYKDSLISIAHYIIDRNK